MKDKIRKFLSEYGYMIAFVSISLAAVVFYGYLIFFSDYDHRPSPPDKLSELYEWNSTDIGNLYNYTLKCYEFESRKTVPKEIKPIVEKCQKIKAIREEIKEREREKNLQEQLEKFEEIENDISGNSL